MSIPDAYENCAADTHGDAELEKEWAIQDLEDVPEVVDPGKVPLHRQPHLLVVEPGSLSFVKHTNDCFNQYGQVWCDMRGAMDEGYEDDLPEGLLPGEYWIVIRDIGVAAQEDITVDLMYPEETPCWCCGGTGLDPDRYNTEDTPLGPQYLSEPCHECQMEEGA